MCGILAILLADGQEHCRQELFDGLTALQHRGQDAAGITTSSTASSWENTKFRTRKDLGLVRDVFKQSDMDELLGNVGIAHCRYPTAGGKGARDETQPMYVNYPCGLALAHNGNLTNMDDQRAMLHSALRHLNTSSDSEVLLNVFGEELRKALIMFTPKSGLGKELMKNVTPMMVFHAVEAMMRRLRGGYAVVVLIQNVGILGFRDPHGIRPMVLGKRDSATAASGVDYVIASETAALDSLGYTLVSDIAPGEALLLMPMIPGKPRENLGLYRQTCHASPSLSPCITEYVYFARADSTIDGVSVYEARLQMGERLARKIQRLFGDGHGVDVVVPVPESARASALQLAYALDRPFREGFVVNRYIGRTFIMPGQKIRRKGVRMKLNTIKAEFKDKRVLLVDDSIVRGTTSTELVTMAREAGAKEVYLASASPEVRHQNFYGIDIPTRSELIAHERGTEEIAKILGVKWLVYQDLTDLEEAARSLNPSIETFESSIFSGKYIVDVKNMDSPASKRTPLSPVQPQVPKDGFVLSSEGDQPPAKCPKLAHSHTSDRLESAF